MYRQGQSGLGLDQDQTNLDGLWQSRSWSQNFCEGQDRLVSGPAKMARDWTRLNFPNTRAHVSVVSVQHVRAVGTHGEGTGGSIGGVASCGRNSVGHMNQGSMRGWKCTGCARQS